MASGPIMKVSTELGSQGFVVLQTQWNGHSSC